MSPAPALPEQLLNSLEGVQGFDRAAFVAAHSTNRVTSIRLNPFKSASLPLPTGKPVPWCEGAYYLEERPAFTLDPLFHAGAYYVQEAGSMFIDFVMRSCCDLSRPLRVLDLCGSPGGKSTLLNSLLSQESVLVSNEPIAGRVDTLIDNLSRWGTANTIVSQCDPSRFSALPAAFDVIVVDAPCSGSGLFRKTPEAVNEWSVDAVMNCSARQKRICGEALTAVRTGGLLIYSTCSYSVAENEDVVDWLETRGFKSVGLAVPPGWGVVDTGKGYRFFPHLADAEGFFCSVLQKVSDEEDAGMPRGTMLALPGKKSLEPAQELLGTTLEFFEQAGWVRAATAGCTGFMRHYGGALYIRKAGCLVGQMKGNDLVPHQECAWSNHITDTVPRAELDIELAVAYLRKASLARISDSEGLLLASYGGLGLGWGKQLPNRFNNYLPNAIRIMR